MRTEREVEEFREELVSEAIDSDENPNSRTIDDKVEMFQACIPRKFWNFPDENITHNRRVFDDVILPYCEQWVDALNKGRGILLLGENGTGKSVFLSRVLCHVVKKNRGAYYTTIPQLDYNIRKGWQNKEAQKTLEDMLQSDFVAFDELNKDRVDRAGESVARDHVNRILKNRSDDELPTLLATNASLDDLRAHMGASFMSIIEGEFEIATMEDGDFRRKIAERRRVVVVKARSA